MAFPVGEIAVFTAITVPYVILLTLFGLPFSHSLFWLYVLPPGVLTWLATRPVLESKRLPELIISQVRYLGEPAAWCRMTPHVEKDEIVVVGRVWRPGPTQPAAAAVPLPAAVRGARPASPRRGRSRRRRARGGGRAGGGGGAGGRPPPRRYLARQPAACRSRPPRSLPGPFRPRPYRATAGPLGPSRPRRRVT